MTQTMDFQHYQQLVASYGSPLYVYELDQVAARITELQNALPDDCRILYSLKSNPLPAIVEQAVAMGCVPEVCSENELSVGLAAVSEDDKSNILFSGPGKTPEEIRFAISQGVIRFSAESWTEMQRLYDIAQTMDTRLEVVVRVNPNATLSSGLSMSGTASQFGFEEEVLLSGQLLAEQCLASEKVNESKGHLENGRARIDHFRSRLSFIGFHVYFGTQIQDEDALVESFSAAVTSMEMLSHELAISPQMIDLGGGFPWAYAKHGEAVNLETLKPRLTTVLENRRYTAKAQVWFEAGRYISASSGSLVSRVMDIKPSKDNTRYVVLDSGINHLGGMAGLGRIPRGYSTLFDQDLNDLADSQNAEYKRTTVVGPLCSPLDCLSRNIEGKGLKVGDLIAIPNVGAYGITASLVGFLSRPAPVEVVLKNGQVSSVYQLNTGHACLNKK